MPNQLDHQHLDLPENQPSDLPENQPDDLRTNLPPNPPTNLHQNLPSYRYPMFSLVSMQESERRSRQTLTLPPRTFVWAFTTASRTAPQVGVTDA